VPASSLSARIRKEGVRLSLDTLGIKRGAKIALVDLAYNCTA
jgi:hypothetical protein